MGTADMDIATRASRIMIVDDHPTICEGLGHRICSQSDMTVCGEAADMTEALKTYAELRPDVVIVDIVLRNSDGLELIKALASRYAHVRALVHSMYDDSIYAERCLSAGAMGYVNKEANPDEVIKAIREIVAGRVYLSPAMTTRMLGRAVRGNRSASDPTEALTDRQLEVFRRMGEGQSAREIADHLHISVHTVETHRDNIKRKLKVESLRDLSRRAVLWVAGNR